MRFSVDKDKLAKLSGNQRDLAVGALRELEYKAKTDPLAFYVPHEKQAIFHAFDAKVRCFFGGNQSGKTMCGLVDDLIQALDREAVPEHLRQFKTHDPPFLCRIMAPSFPVLETTLYPKLQELLPRTQIIGESWTKAFDKNLRVLYFKNGSRFFFMTYKQDPSDMGGATLHRVHYDEEPPRGIRAQGRIRVMRHGGEEMFTMTPVEGLTWTYEAFWLNRGSESETETTYETFIETEGERVKLQIVTVDMDDNPTLSRADKAAALEGLSNEERQAIKSGRFVALHGLIFNDFDPTHWDGDSGNVIPEGPIPDRANVVVGIDPGLRNSCAVIWVYLTPSDKMVVFEEGYFQGMTVSQVAKRIHQYNAKMDVHPIYYVIDPAARNKEHQTGRSDQMEFADHGIVTIAGQNAVRAGINRVKERFQNDRLFVQDNCVGLKDELLKYRWKQPPRNDEDGKEMPVKKDDHGVDALRYICMSRPYLPMEDTKEYETELEKAMREDMGKGDKKRYSHSRFGGVVG